MPIRGVGVTECVNTLIKKKLINLLQVIGSRASEMGTEENERNDLYDKENNRS